MAAQATREQRLAVATHVIDNTGTLDDLRRRVAEVVELLVSAGRAAPEGRDPDPPSDQRPGQAARSGSAALRSFWIASRSS